MKEDTDGKSTEYRERVEKERENRIAQFERFLSVGGEGSSAVRSISPLHTENSDAQRNNKPVSPAREKPKKEQSPDKKNIHKGHRKRMRESARRDPEFDTFSDVQILEYLLAFATPQRDTNPIAHALLDKFGSLIAVFRAPAEELVKVKGVTVMAAEIISMLVKICVWDGKRDIRLTSAASAASYFGSVFLPGGNAAVCVAYLDSGYELIAAERTDYSALELKPIVGAACRHGAHYVLMAMRHDAFPDMSGISESVDSLSYALSLVGIKFIDCLMFTDYGYYSRSADSFGAEFVFYPYRMFVGSSELVSMSLDSDEHDPAFADIDYSAFVRGTAFESPLALSEVAADKDE